MILGTIKESLLEVAVIVINNEIIRIQDINTCFNQKFSNTLFEIINNEQIALLEQWVKSLTAKDHSMLKEVKLSFSQVEFGPLYMNPRKIWGIGLNYVEHASDLNEVAPNTEPASFMKPDTSIIGHEDLIQIPTQSNRTTGEAELGIIIGKECKNIEEEEAPTYVAGLTSIIDMTAEDILEKNPRYLTRSKSFDTFFSFGPLFYTLNEIQEIEKINVATLLNGKVQRKNIVGNMTFKPWELVSFHSKVMTLLPGDIISTGTPGAVVIRDGDIISCQIDNFHDLCNPVTDLKQTN